MKKAIIPILLTLLIGVHFNHARAAATDFPGKTWKQYASPEEAGYSSEKLETARKLFEKSEAASVLVIHDGKVLVSWGETTRRFRCASVRKSYLSALYGIYLNKGKLSLNSTLEELGIDDIQGLTSQEKHARVLDLLTARSGVYLPSAYSPRDMERNLPERGSHAPGTFWYYNNWDFNALGTIFEQRTGKGIFEAFQSDIADPLQMEDFSLWNTHYRNEPDKSRHAAYLFRMSTRDMARFGLLYLNQGRWQRKQIIPASWIEESTRPYTKDLGRFNDRGSYGYLWWISDGVKGQPMYFASGSGGQRISVLPQANMVFVHRVNTYYNNGVSGEQILELIGAILDAKTGEPKSSPRLEEYNAPNRPQPKAVKVADTILKKYEGTYDHRPLGELTVKRENGHLILGTGIGKFKMIPVGEAQFFPEDLETPVFFTATEDAGKRHKAESVYNQQRKVEKVIFHY